ncbi:hypothetical protein SAMN04488102_10879 [Alkalibacterium subtropicum]|uniref:ABC-2 type transport system permease protein n=1 Tax=Alkalibacterium subtropicum TaxID=753702 RepID=A0A1I1JY53_9LACT|nr:hypothetical protein [Alkalibacterium subtropicum]SFC50290.1 hypothetical protein SAMN04488102_10879 [Alkalibacterium subtropicum]
MMRNVFGTGEQAKEPVYLKLIDKLAPLYTKVGVDYRQMRTILEMKMTVDSRKEAVIQSVGSNAKQKEEKNHFFSSLWVYAIISVFLLFLFVYDNWVFQYTTYFSYIFIMLFSTMLANFSNILLDTKDAELIGTKPVSQKTIGAAKATHIGIYLVSFTFAVGLAVMLATFYFNGILAGILIILLTFLSSLWALGLTIIMYSTVLKHFDGEKLKNIIAYSQIGVSIFMVMGYYLMGQIFEVIDPATFLVEMNLSVGHALLFPMWFVAPFGLLQEGIQTVYVVYTLFLVAGTVAIGILYNMNSDKIDSNLQKMNKAKAKPSSRSFLETGTAKLLSAGSLEKAYYHFTWQLTKNEREFKTRLYPSIASAMIFPLVLFFSSLRGDQPITSQNTLTFLYLPYFTMLAIPMIAVATQFSVNYKGSWLFELSPKHAKAPFLRAVTKVMLVKILFPMYGLISLLIVILMGFTYSVQLLNGFLLMSAILYFEMKRSSQGLPFSRKYAASEANQGCMASLIFFIPVFVVSLAMILLQSFVPYAEWGVLVALIALNAWWMNKGFNK